MKKILTFLLLFLFVVSQCFATYKPATEDQKSAFDELLVSELTPIVQLQFPYNINTRIVETRNVTGTTVVSNNKLRLSTGAAANQSAQLLSKIAVKYNPGQGGLCRFTGIYTTGAADSTQYLGIGTSSDGYFFGYDGDTFGILQRQNGSPAIRTLTIATGSSTAENIDVILDGDSTGIAVTNTGDMTLTANEIADGDYSKIGTGWTAHSMGANVVFESYDATLHTGTYSIAGTSVVGAFDSTVSGNTVTDTTVAQSSWNVDKFDGTGASGVTLDPTKGNVYQIGYQWLGFGAIEFSIEKPSTGKFILVHRIQYANANTVPSVNNPTLPLCALVKNTSNTSDIIMEVGSMAGFVEGKNVELGILEAKSIEKSSISTGETPVLSIHNHTIFQDVINRVRAKIELIGVSVDGTKPSTIRMRLNPTLTGASFSAIDSDTSVMRFDSSATSVTGGSVLFTETLSKADSSEIPVKDLGILLNPGETLTVTVEASSGTVDAIVTINWLELF